MGGEAYCDQNIIAIIERKVINHVMARIIKEVVGSCYKYNKSCL